MPNTYGFDKLSLRKLKNDKTPDETAAIHVIEGEAEKGAPVTVEITGLAKEAVKVFGGDIEYFVARKGVGQVAANFGLLDLPPKVEQEVLGYTLMGEGIDGIGDETEAPYFAAFCESEDLYGKPVAFALTCGTFSTDGFSLATKNDEDFTPEPGEYVHSCMSRKIVVDSEEKYFHVMRAFGEAAVTKLKTAVLGTAPSDGGEETGGGQG